MSVQSPKVSVVLYPGKDFTFLGPALESVLTQSFADFEVLVVGDTASPAAQAALESRRDPRVRLLGADSSGGPPALMNKAIRESQAEYVALMCSDDLSRPGRIEKQAAFLGAHPEVALVGTAYEDVDESDHVLTFHDLQCSDAELQEAMLLQNRFCRGAIMARREALIGAGLHDESLEAAEDYDLWLRIAERHGLANLREYLYARRRRAGQPAATDAACLAANRVRRAALRRRAWSCRMSSQATLIAWARAAARDGRMMAASALLLKAIVAAPLSGAPWRLAVRRLSWWGQGVLGLGRAAAFRNERLIAREMQQKKAALRSHPAIVTLLLNDTCNSMCVMCGGDYFSHRSGRRLTVEKVGRILDHLRPKLITSLHFGGAGEPLLNPEFHDIARLVRRRCPHADLLLITNGIAMTDACIETIVANRIDTIVSVNAATAQTFRRMAQVDCFNQVTDSIRRLIAARNRAGARFQVMPSLVGTRRNIEEFPAFVRMAAEMGADRVKMLYCRMYPDTFRHKSCAAAENRLRADESLFYHQKLSDRCVVEATRTAARMGIGFEHVPLFAESSTGGECAYAWRVLYIGFDGEVFWCPGGETLFQAAVESGRYESGNLVKQDIGKIRNNPFHVRLRTALIAQKPCLFECSRCGNSIEWAGVGQESSHVMDWPGVQPGGGN